MQASLLIQALERIFRCMQFNAPSVAQCLQPGLSRKQIESQLQKLPFHLPEEVYQLYQWRNGSAAETQVEFLPQYRILSLEEAITAWRFVYSLRDEANTNSALSNCHWLPLFAEDGSYYAILGSAEYKASSPILYRCYTDFELEFEFNNLTAMMLAIAECFETGAYYFSNHSHLECNRIQAERLLLKYKPQRTANLTAIINNQIQHLSNKKKQAAYLDLVNTQDPQALSILIQTIEKLELELEKLRFWLDRDPTRFETADALEALTLKELEFQQLLHYVEQLNSSEAIRYLQDLMARSNTDNPLIFE